MYLNFRLCKQLKVKLRYVHPTAYIIHYLQLEIEMIFSNIYLVSCYIELPVLGCESP